MQRVEYDIKLIQHQSGSLTARVTSNKSKQVSIFKVPERHIDNDTYIMHMLKSSMIKLSK